MCKDKIILFCNCKIINYHENYIYGKVHQGFEFEVKAKANEVKAKKKEELKKKTSMWITREVEPKGKIINMYRLKT